MTFKACSREKEVKELLARGHWPQACTSELRSHVGACPSCRDLVLVTHTFQQAQELPPAVERRLSPPGVLWWRAQLRRQNAAVERISKPIWGAQIFALAINLLIAVGFVASQAKHGLHWLDNLSQFQIPTLETLWSLTSTMTAWDLMLLISGLATLGVLSGVVLYLAWERH